MRVCVCVSIVTIYLKNYYIYYLESLKKILKNSRIIIKNKFKKIKKLIEHVKKKIDIYFFIVGFDLNV